MDSKYNIAIVGTGAITATHIKALKDIQAFNLVGIHGRDYERACALASKFATKAFKTFQEILDNPDIHVVDITNSSDLHAEYGIQAARYSKNLLIEKPIDISLEKATELVELCEKNKLLLNVIYQRRFDENIVLLKSLIDNGFFGKIISGKITGHPKRGLDYYLKARDTCKGALINYGIHYIDLIIYLMGQAPLKSNGVIKKTRSKLEVEDYANVSMEFDDSRVFSMEVLTNVKKSLPTTIEIHGEKGSVIFWGDKIKFTSMDMSLADAKAIKNACKLYLAKKIKIALKFLPGSHKEVFIDYLGALNGHNKVSANGHDALKSLKIVTDVYLQNGYL